MYDEIRDSKIGVRDEFKKTVPDQSTAKIQGQKEEAQAQGGTGSTSAATNSGGCCGTCGTFGACQGKQGFWL
jgi:hypothetical protein